MIEHLAGDDELVGGRQGREIAHLPVHRFGRPDCRC